MKIGGENRTKVIALAVLGGIAVILFARMLLLSNRPERVSAAPTSPNATQVRHGGRTAAPAVAAPTLDPELRLGLLESTEGTVYEGKGRNIFVPLLEPPPQPVASGLIQTKPPEPPPVPQPPPPPPIPLKFFGFASHPGETKRIFLSQGEDVFIGGEGDIVDRRYKIVRINPTSVEIEDVLNNNRQTIPLTQS